MPKTSSRCTECVSSGRLIIEGIAVCCVTPSVTRASQQLCYTLPGPCNNKRCENYGICASKEDGTSHCKCPNAEDCPKVNIPVCGTDSNTYPNLCVMQAESCTQNIPIRLKHQGQCGKFTILALVLHVTLSDIIMCRRVSFRVRVATLYNRTHNNWVT